MPKNQIELEKAGIVIIPSTVGPSTKDLLDWIRDHYPGDEPKDSLQKSIFKLLEVKI